MNQTIITNRFVPAVGHGDLDGVHSLPSGAAVIPDSSAQLGGEGVVGSDLLHSVLAGEVKALDGAAALGGLGLDLYGVGTLHVHAVGGVRHLDLRNGSLRAGEGEPVITLGVKTIGQHLQTMTAIIRLFPVVSSRIAVFIQQGNGRAGAGLDEGKHVAGIGSVFPGEGHLQGNSAFVGLLIGDLGLIQLAVVALVLQAHAGEHGFGSGGLVQVDVVHVGDLGVLGNYLNAEGVAFAQVYAGKLTSGAIGANSGNGLLAPALIGQSDSGVLREGHIHGEAGARVVGVCGHLNIGGLGRGDVGGVAVVAVAIGHLHGQQVASRVCLHIGNAEGNQGPVITIIVGGIQSKNIGPRISAIVEPVSSAGINRSYPGGVLVTRICYVFNQGQVGEIIYQFEGGDDAFLVIPIGDFDVDVVSALAAIGKLGLTHLFRNGEALEGRGVYVVHFVIFRAAVRSVHANFVGVDYFHGGAIFTVNSLEVGALQGAAIFLKSRMLSAKLQVDVDLVSHVVHGPIGHNVFPGVSTSGQALQGSHGAVGGLVHRDGEGITVLRLLVAPVGVLLHHSNNGEGVLVRGAGGVAVGQVDNGGARSGDRLLVALVVNVQKPHVVLQVGGQGHFLVTHGDGVAVAIDRSVLPVDIQIIDVICLRSGSTERNHREDQHESQEHRK